MKNINQDETNLLEFTAKIDANPRQIVMLLREYNTYIMQYRADGDDKYLVKAKQVYNELNDELRRFGLQAVKKHR